MQPASMLGVAPVQGSSFLNTSEVVGGGATHRGLDQHQPPQLLSQSEQHVPCHPKMDDLMEMFASPSWPEINSTGRLPWDFNGASSTNPTPQKTFTMPLMPSGLPGSSTGRQGLAFQVREVQDNMGQPHTHEPLQYPSNDLLVASRLNQQRGLQGAVIGSTDGSGVVQSIDGHISQGMQEAALNARRRISEGSSRAPGLIRSPSLGSSGSEISGCQQLSSDTQSPPSVAPMWRQPYMGGVLSLPLDVGQVKAENFIPQEGSQNEAALGKRPRDDEGQAGPQETMFNTFTGAQAQQASHPQIQVSHGVSVPPYASHTGLGQPQGATAVVAGTARPRVRARRGQATDPHSIAERLRRERIAERMKALQELVPNSNKTLEYYSKMVKEY